MATVDEDLNQLEKDIRQLKVEYDQFFGGGKKRPPADIEWRIEQLIRRYAERIAEINFGQRFRYNNLAQTYAKYREVFRKRFKQKEEGTVSRHFGVAAKAIEAERTGGRPVDGAAGAKPGTLFAVTCSDPDSEPEKVEQLFRAFRSAKENAGESTNGLTQQNFREFLRRKTQQLKTGEGSEQLEYVVALEGGQVRLKARVKK